MSLGYTLLVFGIVFFVEFQRRLKSRDKMIEVKAMSIGAISALVPLLLFYLYLVVPIDFNNYIYRDANKVPSILTVRIQTVDIIISFTILIIVPIVIYLFARKVIK